MKRNGKHARSMGLHAPATTSRCVALLVVSLLSPLVAAEPIALNGGITVTHQVSDDRRVRDETSASVDLVLTWPRSSGEWRLYIEGNASPRRNGVSSILPEANADAGSALDKDDKGRAQISELAYVHRIAAQRQLTVGLIDITGYFDQSRIASDENTQFLGVSFVQNPTIEFPDYALGAVYEHGFTSGATAQAGLSSSHGISDNPNASYAQLVDVDNTDKGVFAITSLSWRQPSWQFRSGIWTRSDPHAQLDGARRDRHHYGWYFLAGYQQQAHGVNLRLGAARKDVARAAEFAALSYQYKFDPFVFGAGAARLFLSPRETASNLDDTQHYEVYLRYRLMKGVYLTADAQQLTNSNFSTSAATRDPKLMIYSVRFSYVLD